MIKTIKDMKDEIRARATAQGLEVKCINDGTITSQVAIVAEAPGEREVSSGIPLSGTSGAHLWGTLRKHKLNRTDFYVTNVCKRQVSMGNDKRHPINKHELDQWISLLRWELSQLPNLKYVVVMGNMALQAVCKLSGITNWRGSVLDIEFEGRKIKAICTYNAAMIIREPKLELTFAMDIHKVRKVLDDQWHPIDVKTILNPSADDAIDWIRKMRTDGKPVAHDLEVLANETACIGLANSTDEAMCINFRTFDTQAFTLEQERHIRRELQSFYEDKNVRTVAQNNMFDASWLWFKDRIWVAPAYADTMLMHHALYPVLPHNLGFITTQYTQRPYYKNEKDAWREGGNIDEFWHYNGQDCCNTLEAAFKMEAELKEQQLWGFFQNHVMRAQPHLIRMVVGGVKVDTEYHATLKVTLEERVNKLLDEFHEKVHVATGDPDFNPNPKSPKQMTELYFSRLRLVGRGTSTDYENRQRMFAHPATTEAKRDVIRAVDAYSEEQKFLSTNLNAGYDDDGRMRSTYNQTGVVSAPGRLSSSGMLWKNAQGVQTGTNLQNQPERAHSMFIADEGYGLGYFDLTQAEAQVVGRYANITSWNEQYARALVDGKFDAHRALASEMFHMPYDEVPTADREDNGKVTVRYIAKRCRHGLNYRMGPDRLATVTGLSMADATTAYKLYHKSTPELQRWWGDLEREVRETRMLFNAYGRRFILLERLSPEALESIVAFKPQSTIGDKVTRVIYMCESDPNWPRNSRVFLNIHDALVCIAPLHSLQRAISIMKKHAMEPIYINGEPLIINAETKISFKNERGHHSWGSLKKIDIEAAK